jgi:hypothetical protein
MRNYLGIAVAFFIAVDVAAGQAVASDLAKPDSASLVSLKANRVGITASRGELSTRTMSARAESSSRHSKVGTRVAHSFLGGGLGLLGGAGVGALVGAIIDRRPADDAMIPASAILAMYGSIAGFFAGVVIGALWPSG